MKRRLQAMILTAALIASSGINVAAEDLAKDAVVGISIYQFEDDFMTLYRTELVRYLTEELGFSEKNILVEDAGNNRSLQKEQIKSFIDQQVDVMILNLVQPSGAPGVTDLCGEAGIPAVYINRQPYESECRRWETEELMASYVGADARQSGIYQGEEIAATENSGDMNGDGEVAYIMIQGDPRNIDTQYRSAYSVKALEAAGLKTKELLAEDGGWNRQQGKEIAAKALKQYGDQIEVVFCNNDAMALGALEAIQDAGRTVGKDILLSGIDALPEAVEKVLEGHMTGTVFNDYISQSHCAAQTALNYLKGEGPEAVNLVDYIKVTADNAEDILKKISR